MIKYMAIILAIAPIILSGIALFWLLLARRRWFIRTLVCGTIILFAFLAGPWAFISYYLRYILIFLYVLVAIISYQRTKMVRDDYRKYLAGISIPSAFMLLLFLGLNVLTIGSYFYTGETISLTFPFQSGSYYVLQGGTSIITNPFHTLRRRTNALDIVKLNRFGNRANGISPNNLKSYEIFGEKLLSPCSGRILQVRDSLQDNPPGQIHVDYPLGNYIKMQCADSEVLLAHLKHNSILVNEGDTLTSGQALGTIGNTGFTIEPHLHIEAEKGGKPMVIKFNGRILSINSLVINNNN